MSVALWIYLFAGLGLIVAFAKLASEGKDGWGWAVFLILCWLGALDDVETCPAAESSITEEVRPTAPTRRLI